MILFLNFKRENDFLALFRRIGIDTYFPPILPIYQFLLSHYSNSMQKYEHPAEQRNDCEKPRDEIPLDKPFIQIKSKRGLNIKKLYYLLDSIYILGHLRDFFDITWEEMYSLQSANILICLFALSCMLSFCVMLCQKSLKFKEKHLFFPAIIK